MERFRASLNSLLLLLAQGGNRLSQNWREGANQRTIALFLALGFLFLLLYGKFIAPPAEFPLNTLVSVPEGAGLYEIAAQLETEGVIRDAAALSILVSFLGRESEVRAGDYIFKEPATAFSIARILTRGQYGLEPERIRIHEGATAREMAKIFSARLLRADAEEFIRAAEPFEGYLFPDTYYFLPNVSEATIVRTMRQNFDEKILRIAGEIASSERSLNDVVKMASLLEREARNHEDRRRIAGVLWRRLDRGMLLQVDAAFLYTLGKGTFDLTLQDLRSDSPYNTYKFKGLPPTPIGSPSLSSLKAAVTPIDEGYLFYLADHRGVTYYSKTYEEHLRKKAIYLGT